MESAPMISPSKRRASSMEKPVLPTPVGPQMTIIFGLEGML